MIKENLIKIFEDRFKKSWNCPAITDYTDKITITYGELEKEIEKLHLIFQNAGVKKGDKISLIGKNNRNWCAVFLASMTYGTVIVPILQDFNPLDIERIINHSDSKILFISENIWKSISQKNLSNTKIAISLDRFSLLYKDEDQSTEDIIGDIDSIFNRKYPKGLSPEMVKFEEFSNDNLLLISYTSGTMGFTKGVMLSANAIAANVVFALNEKLIHEHDNLVSVLPLAHAYGCAFEFLYVLAQGGHLTLLGKTPSPAILLNAFRQIKPKLIILVPLIIEKMYKNIILPAIKKFPANIMIKIPGFKQYIYHQINEKLKEALGGEFTQVVIGGAALNGEVEDFLLKIKFPLTVGYGMTECGPLVSYSKYTDFVKGSCGKTIYTLDVRIDSKDPYHTEGEIQVKGENIMNGYYKDEAGSRSAFTSDDWLKTGDLGTIDKEKNIFIKGRSKSMILSSSGQNIFPEEIESKLNNLPYVSESLVISKGKKLFALVHPDYEKLESDGIQKEEDIAKIMGRNKIKLNSMLASYEKISEITIFKTEFEKTPKKSIKRFLYLKKAVPEKK